MWFLRILVYIYIAAALLMQFMGWATATSCPHSAIARKDETNVRLQRSRSYTILEVLVAVAGAGTF